MNYFVGDIHGCYKEFKYILSKINFNLNNDILWITGDILSRGPEPLKVLKFLYSIKDNVNIVLGNHDIYLLANYFGRNYVPKNLLFKDLEILMDWLRNFPLLKIDEKKRIIMVHAGVFPKWDINTLKKYVREIEEMILNDVKYVFLLEYFAKRSKKNVWSKNLPNNKRMEFILNSLICMRYCYPDGSLDLCNKEFPQKKFYPLKPWFSFRRNIPKDYIIIFGHWSSLNGFYIPNYIYNLDTGCYWSGCLTFLRFEDKLFFRSKSF